MSGCALRLSAGRIKGFVIIITGIFGVSPGMGNDAFCA